jgi:hypothetical protein
MAARKSRTVACRRETFGCGDAWARLTQVSPGARTTWQGTLRRTRRTHVASRRWTASHCGGRHGAGDRSGFTRHDLLSPDPAVPLAATSVLANAGRDLPRHRLGARGVPARDGERVVNRLGSGWRPGPGAGAPMQRAVAGISKARHTLDGEELRRPVRCRPRRLGTKVVHVRDRRWAWPVPSRARRGRPQRAHRADASDANLHADYSHRRAL